MIWIFLSPHLDDAVWSCGGLLAERTHDGEESAVWTLFTGDPPAGKISQFAKKMQDQEGITLDSYQERREEDRAACTIIGAAWRHFGYLDCIYRRDAADGRFLYTTGKQVFGNLADADKSIRDSIAADLAKSLPQPGRFVAPLSLGNHVDHRLARIASERVTRDVWYYEDFPYVTNQLRQLERIERNGWTPEIHPISAHSLRLWQDSVAAYASQVALFSKSDAETRAAVQRNCERMGGVRLWRKPL
jgi:LmbE family N-acetylglucosaminyl deacetylase